jgi:hypothetical protein
MNITIFETEHFEGAFPVIKLFDTPGNNITVITSGETYKCFADLLLTNTNRYNWTILPSTGKLRFFRSLYKNLKKQKPGTLYINTISNNHILYALVLFLLPLKRVVLTVHDINCLFESRPSWRFRQAIIHWGKRWLLRQVNEFNVVSDTMIPYLKEKAKAKPTHVIPGAVFEHKQSKQAIDNRLILVVPGSLDKRRRDYEQVFALAAVADKEKLPLTIILLGGYHDEYGSSISLRAGKFESGYCNISAYNTRMVHQAEFDQQMDASHFVFIPSVIDTKICGDIPEIYGITKSSGNIFDVIKHAKPFIVPAGLSISHQLQTSCVKYNNINDLVIFLKSLIAVPREYDKWQERAFANSLNYTIEKVRQNNVTLF